MELLYQRFWHSVVYRESEQYIRAQTSYADSDTQLSLELLVDSADLIIHEAYLDSYGSPGNMIEKRQEIVNLKGVQAYVGQGKALQRATQDIEEKMIRSLINETVTSIVQAETCLLPERGYSSEEEYNQAWNRFYAGRCRYFSNLDRVSSSWSDFLGSQTPHYKLFDCFKSQQLYRHEAGAYLITGNHRDSFHHLASLLEVDEENKSIKRVEGSLLQVPDELCRECANPLMQQLQGLVIPGITKKELVIRMGGGQGCVHLIDLFYDGIQTLERFWGRNG